MKVLHLPQDIASQMSVTIKALNRIGIEAHGLVNSQPVIQSLEGVEIIDMAYKNRADQFIKMMRYLPRIFSLINWADVIHWHFGESALPRYLDFYWSRLLRKPGVVEFWGSDIRIAEVESKDNPYYAEARRQGQYPHIDSFDSSVEQQLRFSHAGHNCILSCQSLYPYIQPGLFKKIHYVRQRVFLPGFHPQYPRANQVRPIVVHSPSNPGVKGTSAVLSAVKALSNQFNFEFRLVQGMPRNQALQVVSECDIFLDQFIGGGHGIAALEAMALGKPVVCYIKPSMIDKYPPDLPIVNANIDNLQELLSELLVDGQRRHDLGRRGRAYVEKHHDANKIAFQLKDIYLNLVEKNNGSNEHR